MPGRDGTGPRGMGPMTGRGAGYCAGYVIRGTQGTAGGRFGAFGRGRGFGLGRCWNGMMSLRGVFAPPQSVGSSTTDERDVLQEQTCVLEEELARLKQRLAELEREVK